MIISTPRLRLEPFHDSHFDGLLAMNSDPTVMRYLGGPQTEDELRASIAAVRDRWERLGYSWWSLIDRQSEQLVGAGCIQNIGKDETKPLEVGWRLRPEHWGKGYATEAGQAMLHFAFNEIGAPEVYALADPENHASRRVMERLGMRYVGPQPFYGAACATYLKERNDTAGRASGQVLHLLGSGLIIDYSALVT